MSFPCISAIFHRNCILLINDFVSPSADTVELLLPLAEKLSVTKLQAECETMLIGKFQSLKNDVDRMKYLLLAQSYTLPSLYDVCVNQLGHVPLGKLKKWRGFQEVSLTTMSDLMACRLQLMELCATEEEDANSVGILNEVVDYILGIFGMPTPTHPHPHTGTLTNTHTPMIITHNTMMTSLNGNIFRVTGHLCGKFTGLRWIPRTKASDAELWCFLWSASK